MLLLPKGHLLKNKGDRSKKRSFLFTPHQDLSGVVCNQIMEHQVFGGGVCPATHALADERKQRVHSRKEGAVEGHIAVAIAAVEARRAGEVVSFRALMEELEATCTPAKIERLLSQAERDLGVHEPAPA